MFRSRKNADTVRDLLESHFGSGPLHELVTSSRSFPVTARLDLQSALEETLPEAFDVIRQVGAHAEVGHETITFSTLATGGHWEVMIAPLQFEEIDTVDPRPGRCLHNSIWLCRSRSGEPFAVVMTPSMKYGRMGGTHLEVAVFPGEEGAGISDRLLESVEKKIARAQSYRGKVLSLEHVDDYGGGAQQIRVHRLREVRREEVILPGKTLALLERNVMGFIEHRDRLNEKKLGIKKGLLFYGPPGTGKTHTIHFLASQVPDHTTFLITADQVALLPEYMQLARFLQPAIVVMEDVDLIARARENMRHPCEESLLNRLLNEMDGLREEAEVLFILTTNRPDQLESALASRPGRIDQSIEFPLPDEEGRAKLVHLYSGDLEVPEEVVRFIVGKTGKASAAFIKELMRRAAQFQFESGAEGLEEEQVRSALEEMLFAGGSLNARLLGVQASPESD